MKSIFTDLAKISPEALNERCKNTLNTALGIVFTEIGPDYLKATMPVNENTIQPMGILNGGASLAMIETLGSMAANLAIDREKFAGVGQNISGHHFKPAFKGERVNAIATPLHLGKTSHVWEVLITKETGESVCKGNITIAIVPLERIRG